MAHFRERFWVSRVIDAEGQIVVGERTLSCQETTGGSRLKSMVYLRGVKKGPLVLPLLIFFGEEVVRGNSEIIPFKP